MSMIKSLGYLGLTAPDLDAWRVFGTEVLGLQAVDRGTADRLDLRMDDRAWRISITPGEGELDYIGWEVSSKRDLEEAARALDSSGVPVSESPELAAERGVKELIRFKDPGGNQLELFYGALLPRDPFISPTGVRFVTGELGLGHVVLADSDITDMATFYRDLLGFRVSDTMSIGPIDLVFTHINPRHHSLALAQIPGNPERLSHLMIEVDDLDAVGRALDAILDGAAELSRTLGRHSNDRMVSFYAKTPSGCDIEYGWGARLVDTEAWTEGSYDAPSLWGHRSTRFHQ